MIISKIIVGILPNKNAGITGYLYIYMKVIYGYDIDMYVLFFI
jgi:hypothetical protein